MKTQQYHIDDVLLITYKDKEILARVVGSVDDTVEDKLLYLHVNLRIADGQRWSSYIRKIQPSQIVKALPNWQKEQHEKWEASIKKTADEAYARMTPEQKEWLHKEATIRRNRSPLDIMIDRACEIE